MRLLLISAIISLVSSAYAANPLKKSDNINHVNQPLIPGTRQPIEEMNTAPNDPQLEEENKNSRFMLQKKLDEEAKEKIKKPTND